MDVEWEPKVVQLHVVWGWGLMFGLFKMHHPQRYTHKKKKR